MIETATSLLDIKNLEISITANKGKFYPIVKDVNLKIHKREVVGLVGESGCGKTITGLSITRLLQTPPLDITGGEIIFNGENLLKKKDSEISKIRGKEISMIFQEHMNALNPTMPVGEQVMEIYRLHLGLSRHHALMRTIEIFKMVGIAEPQRVINSYPHELSGGMGQRIGIAMAIACNPQLIIADEPTTALDVTIQAQVLDLLLRLRSDFNTSMLFISHDLGIVAHVASRIYVMYSGEIIEEGPTVDIFSTPIHPYTLALLSSVPRLEEVALGKSRLSCIPGKPLSATEKYNGCSYAPRCEFAFDKCLQLAPPLLDYSINRKSRCWLITPYEPS